MARHQQIEQLLARAGSAIAMLIIWALAGCSELDSKTTTLVIYVRGVTPLQDQVWYRLGEAYQRHRPDVRLKILSIPYDVYWSKLFTMISSGNPPDLVLMESGFYHSFVDKGAFLDLSPLLAQSTDFSLDQFYPQPFEWLRKGPSIFGIPIDSAVILPFYNQDLFDRAGVPYPDENWTWDDYIATSSRLTSDTDGDGRLDVWGSILPPWEPYLWAAGGDWVDDPEQPTRCTFGDRVNIEAIQSLIKARDQHRIAPRTSELNDQVDPFVMQKVAITWSGHWQLNDYEQKLAFRWDVATLPHGPNGPAGWNSGSCFSIPLRSHHHAQAWDAIKFLCGAEGSRVLAAENFITPVVRAVSEDPDFINRRPPEHHQRFMQAIAHGHIYPKTPVFHELRSMINTELQLVWIGEEDVRSVCERIGRNGTAMLRGEQERDRP